jgi:hypothetical protein
MDLTQYLKTRARACRVAAEGADVMVTQSRGGVRWSECFQIRCLESAVRLERRDGEVTRGCCSIDTVPTVSAIAAAPRDANFDVLGFCGGIRASVSVLRSSKSALTRLRTRYEPSADPFASVRYRPVTAVVLWRAGEDWEFAVDRKHLAPALLPARSTDWP